MLVKKFLTRATDINKACYIWNLVYSILFGFQSVFILAILTRTVGLDEAGVFTIAYSNATLFLFIGKFGVRNYQVSDISNVHSFGDYFQSRLISTFIMFLVSFVYVLYCTFTREYSFDKFQIIFWVCISKIPDALEDVYAGEYQKQGRLDIALKMMSLRIAVSTAALCICACWFKNLQLAVIISTIISFVTMCIVIKLTAASFRIHWQKDNKSIKTIFAECFPIFLGTFLNQYINNVPKYAIDTYMTDDVQACYGFIAMPVFVIGLFSNVVLQPAVYSMAENWARRKKDVFIRQFWQQIAIALILTAVAVTGAWFIGCPALSILYGTDLLKYRYELIVLLVGGGFLAVSQILNTVITIIRKQGYLLSSYMLTAVLASFLLDRLVINYGIKGSAVGYTIVVAVLAIAFSGVFMWGIMKND